jgi:ankyrin repeat protein
MEWDGVRQQYIHTFLNRSDDQIALQSLSVLASLGQPVEVNNRDKRGRTPLHHAASREYLVPSPACAVCRVCRVPCVSCINSSFRFTRLPWCVWRLLQMGADPSIVDNWGNSPLAYAAHASAWDICRQLLSAGADLNAFYQPPRTPCLLALFCFVLFLKRNMVFLF